jgi:hypothetical protein
LAVAGVFCLCVGLSGCETIETINRTATSSEGKGAGLGGDVKPGADTTLAETTQTAKEYNEKAGEAYRKTNRIYRDVERNVETIRRGGVTDVLGW